jgi:predicted Zn finger-like uncharacterized protein
MPPSNPDDALLLIRCPSCGQRFKVAEDLRGRTVECGGCEHRFRINDEAIVRGRKFYPGERKDPRLHRFHRVPLSVAPPVMGTPTISYEDAPDPSLLEPASPQRILAGLIGGAGMAMMALLLILGAKRGGALDGITTENRLIMAAFTGLLGLVLLIYANRRARGKAITLGLLSTAALVSLPFFFTEGSKHVESREVTRPAPEQALDDPAAPPEELDAFSELRRRIGTDPLVAEIKRLEDEGSNLRAVGLWLRNMQERNRFLIMDYILRATGADRQSHYYPRDQGDFLMVITGIDMTLNEVAKVAAALGSVERSLPELSVIEVRVNNDNFVEGPLEKLADRANPAFYDLNKRELESIDLDRIERAVKRLAEAEPKIYRDDISRKLLALLAMPEVKFKAAVANALAVWSEEPTAAAAVALQEVEKLLERSAPVPEEMIQLIIPSKNPDLLPILDKLWSQNPNQWEGAFAAIGQAAEPVLLSRFEDAKGWHRQSAVRLLGRIGGPQSLPVLQEARNGADPELRVLIDKSIEAIRSREG